MEGENETQNPAPAASPVTPPAPPPATPVVEVTPTSLTSQTAPLNEGAWRTYLIAAVVALFLLFVSIAAFYLFWPWPEAQELALEPETPFEGTGIGSELYERSVNPLRSAFPETEAQVANPIDDAYQNPFQ